MKHKVINNKILNIQSSVHHEKQQRRIVMVLNIHNEKQQEDRDGTEYTIMSS